MKNSVAIQFFCITVMIFCLIGCNNQPSPTSRNQTTSKSVEQVLTENVSSSEQNDAQAPSEKSPVTNDKEDLGITTEKTETSKPIDIDLTKLSSTLVYSEVFNMVTEPEKYEGKRIALISHGGGRSFCKYV